MARKSPAPAPAELDHHDATRASYVVGCHVDDVVAIDYAEGVAAGDLEGAVVTLARRSRLNGVAVIIGEQRRIVAGGWARVGEVTFTDAPEPEPEPELEAAPADATEGEPEAADEAAPETE
jgi:hypothetical protein